MSAPTEAEVAAMIAWLRPLAMIGATEVADMLAAQQSEITRLTGLLNGRTFTVDEGAEWKSCAERAKLAECDDADRRMAEAEVRAFAEMDRLLE